MLKINNFAQQVHENAVAHGWWDKDTTFGDFIALCHSELSEAMQEYRKGTPMMHTYCGAKTNEECICDCEACDKRAPQGIAVELADCILRILDYCARHGIDIEEALLVKHEYNKTRPYRHGGKVL